MPAEPGAPSPSVGRTEIRKAQPLDIADLTALEASAFGTDRLSRRSIATLIARPSAAILVACRDGALAGYALVLTRRGSRAARLYSIAVAPEAAGGGIGARLLAAAEAEAIARGAQRLRLEVRSDNTAAIRLYETRGYTPIGRREDYYEDGATALRYERNLRAGAPVAPDRPSLDCAA
jgi:ribosomal protein S18 acetylase RimI-like enzyme